MNEKNTNLSESKQEKTWQEILGAKPMFISMPLNTEQQAKAQQDYSIFNRKYLEMLEELFAEDFVSYERAQTDIGACLALDLHPGNVWDYGSQMKALSGSPEEINAMIRLAKAKQWTGIHLSGSEDFKERVFLQAVLSGTYKAHQITGYEPSARAMEIIGLSARIKSSQGTQEPIAKPEEFSTQASAKKLKA